MDPSISAVASSKQHPRRPEQQQQQQQLSDPSDGMDKNDNVEPSPRSTSLAEEQHQPPRSWMKDFSENIANKSIITPTSNFFSVDNNHNDDNDSAVPDLYLAASSVSEATFESGVASLQRSLLDRVHDNDDDDEEEEGGEKDNEHDDNGDDNDDEKDDHEKQSESTRIRRRRSSTSPNHHHHHHDSSHQMVEPPSKRPRRHHSTSLSTSQQQQQQQQPPATISPTPPSALSPQEWDVFVRQGACLKSFLGDAFQRLKRTSTTPTTAIAITNNNDNKLPSTETSAANNAEGDETENGMPIVMEFHPDHIAELAREKTAECMILQRKLQDAERHATSLTATNDSLREERQSTLSRLDKASAALRMAGQNAAQARADADSAEAFAAGLASQLQALKTVIEETKMASQILYHEQEHVSAAAQSIEAKYVTTQAELLRCQHELRRAEQDKQQLQRQLQEMQETQEALNRMVRHQKDELQDMKQVVAEQEALEHARQHRMTQLEDELRQAQTMLVRATSTVAEQEKTIQSLQEAMRTLQDENGQWHQRFQQQQDWAQAEQERLQENWTKAEQERQALRMEAASQDEQVQRLTMEHTDKDQQIAELQNQVATLERRLQIEEQDKLQTTSPHPNKSLGFFAIPPLTPSSLSTANLEGAATSPTAAAATAPTCCICYKTAFGLMKSCQCINAKCDKRAHTSCVHKIQAGPSVAHPGTPAPRLPLILCTGNFHNPMSPPTTKTTAATTTTTPGSNHNTSTQMEGTKQEGE